VYFTLSLDGGHVTQQTPDNAVAPGEWLHASATWDGSVARIYVNGEMMLEQAQAGTNINSITIGIGTKNVPAPAGGTGTMYFDDIGLIR